MAYQIEYAYTCHMGKVRANNEDNFWCCGKSLPAENQGAEGIYSEIVSGSKIPALAVFDGMGGESCGEMAAFLASEEFGKYYNAHKRVLRDMPENFIEGVCKNAGMEQKIIFRAWEAPWQWRCLHRSRCLSVILETAESIFRTENSFTSFPQIMYLAEALSEKLR